MRKSRNNIFVVVMCVLIVLFISFLYLTGFLCFFPGTKQIVSNVLSASDNSFDIKILREQKCFNSFSDGTSRIALWNIVLEKENGEQLKKPLDRYLYYHLSSDIKSKREIRYTLAWEKEDRVIGYEDTTGRSGKIFIYDDYLYFGNEFIYADNLERIPVDAQIQTTLSSTIVSENDLSEYSCVFVGSGTRSFDQQTVINNNPHIILIVEKDIYKGIISSGPLVLNGLDQELYITPEWIQVNEGFNVYSFFEHDNMKHVYLSCNRIYLNDEEYESYKMLEKDLPSSIDFEVRKIE